MTIVKVSGASDDLIEIEGDALNEEFSALTEQFEDRADAGALLAFSDGTVLEILYAMPGDGGFWRIRRLMAGSAKYELREATDEDKDYSDVATLTGDLRWVVRGDQVARAKGVSTPAGRVSDSEDT